MILNIFSCVYWPCVCPLWRNVYSGVFAHFGVGCFDAVKPTKVRLVKAMVFPVVMYGCESWTIKKAECQRIDDFELWC